MLNRNFTIFKTEKIFKTLVFANLLISIAITASIFDTNNYTFSDITMGLVITTCYAAIWFFSLYKIYNFKKLGLKLYITLVILGLIFNILSNITYLNKILYIFTITEHMVIGSILTFSFFSKLKSKFS